MTLYVIAYAFTPPLAAKRAAVAPPDGPESPAVREHKLCCGSATGDVEQCERPHFEPSRTVGRDPPKRASRELEVVVG
eukprot:scaffold2979_cov111-Isochrysis_galbana.AAC.3